MSRNINVLRKALGLTQRDLAVLIGTSQPAVAQMEGGKRPVTESMSKRLDAAIDTATEERAKRLESMAEAVDRAFDKLEPMRRAHGMGK